MGLTKSHWDIKSSTGFQIQKCFKLVHNRKVLNIIQELNQIKLPILYIYSDQHKI